MKGQESLLHSYVLKRQLLSGLSCFFLESPSTCGRKRANMKRYTGNRSVFIPKQGSGLSSTENQLEQRAQDLFPILLLVTIAAFAYFIATLPEIIVPREFPFGILKVLPQQYWLVLSMSVVLLGTSLLSRRTSYLWISSILLTVLIPGLGDLINSYPRDVFAIVAAQRISMSGYFSPADHVFLNFPGPEIIFSSLVLVTGTSALNVIRGFGLIYNPILLALGFALFRRLGIDRQPALLAALVLVMSFYMQGVLVYTSLMGFVFYVAIAGLILAPFTSQSANTLLLIVLFTAMVISHAFSPFLTVVAVAVLLLGWKLADSILRRVGLSTLRADPPLVSRLILVAFLLILTTYWAYFAFIPFSWGLLKLNSVDFFSLIGGAIAPLASPSTVYQQSYVRVTQLYAPVLFFTFLVYFFSSKDRRATQMLLLLIGLGATIFVALSGYTEEFLARIFAFATLPLSYGVGKLFESKRKLLQAVALIALLMVTPLHLPAHYGQDSFEVFHDSSFHGLRFLAQHSFLNATYNSPLRELSWHYYIDIYRSDNSVDPRPGSYYVLNYASGSWIIYSNADQALQRLDQQLNSTQYERVYSNGMFDLYLQDPTS